MQVEKFKFTSFDPESEEELFCETIESEHIEQVNVNPDEQEENLEITQEPVSEEIKEISNEDFLSVLNEIDKKIEEAANVNLKNINLLIHDLSLIAAKIAKKIALSALKDNPINEIEEFLKNSISFFILEKDIKIYLNSSMIEFVKNKMDELYPEFILKNNVSFEAKDDYENYNCSIIWQNGSLELNKEELIKKIESIF